jgi:drug/metabolite transporter (DMT)-like permease
LWASLIGFGVWGETPEAMTIAGAIVVAGSGGYILWREITAARAQRAG